MRTKHGVLVESATGTRGSDSRGANRGDSSAALPVWDRRPVGVGPGNPDASTVLAVAPGARDVTGDGGYLRQYFGSVRIVGTMHNPAGIHNQEWGGHVYLCTHPQQPWAAIWPHLRHSG